MCMYDGVKVKHEGGTSTVAVARVLLRQLPFCFVCPCVRVSVYLVSCVLCLGTVAKPPMQCRVSCVFCV